MQSEPIAHNDSGQFDRLLKPRSVAIVGASDKPGSLGASVLANLERLGYSGAIHLVNPGRSMIGKRLCFASIDELPANVDAAVLAIPRAVVLESVRALARRGVGAAVIFSAGFAEDGEEGRAEQAEIARIARDAGMVIEGPNCLGLVNFSDNIALTFVELPDAQARGEKQLGIVSQSGAMAAVLATTMIAREVPLSCYISTGNEAASGVEDFVEYLVADPGTRVIGMIVEHFRNPQRFLSAACAARQAGKTIVLLHPGRSDAARMSAATHTGALAGDYEVMKVHVERAEVILVETLEELGDVCEIALRCLRLPHGATAVLAESGAFKAMTLDLCDQLGVFLPPFNDLDSPTLRAELPSFVPVSNPLDITAQGLVDPTLYTRTLGALLADRRVDTIAVTLIQTMEHTSQIKFRAIQAAINALTPEKPVLVAGLDEGGGVGPSEIAALRALGVPYFPTTERMFRAIRTLTEHATRSIAKVQTGGVVIGELPSGGVVPEYRAKELLAPLGIPFLPAEMATSREEAMAAASRIGFPVVLKAQSAGLTHKSDSGGVVVGLVDQQAVAAGWDRMHRDVAAACPGLVLDGVLVEKMGERGVELILGARNDPEWGPVILAGFGGVTAEILRDVRLMAPDLTREDIVADLRRLRMGRLLDGFRGAPPVDLDAVADIVMTLGQLMTAYPQIREIDLNPVVVLESGAVALDALISV